MLEEYSIEIKSVKAPPISLAMCDSISCPICDVDLADENEIDLASFNVDNDTIIYCEGCDINLRFKIVRI
jgi:hypothetical protein